MIRAHTDRSNNLASALAEKAELLGRAHAGNRILARRSNPLRWRKAGLLWPLFTKD